MGSIISESNFKHELLNVSYHAGGRLLTLGIQLVGVLIQTITDQIANAGLRCYQCLISQPFHST